MTANTPVQTDMDAGAVSHANAEWYTIDWHAAHKNVRRLQARIVQATKEGKWGKVRSLPLEKAYKRFLRVSEK